jgi:hypothetical protein
MPSSVRKLIEFCEKNVTRFEVLVIEFDCSKILTLRCSDANASAVSFEVIPKPIIAISVLIMLFINNLHILLMKN